MSRVAGSATAVADVEIDPLIRPCGPPSPNREKGDRRCERPLATRCGHRAPPPCSGQQLSFTNGRSCYGDHMLSQTAHRIARWHPIILTTILIAGLFVQMGAAGLHLSPLARGVLLLTPLGPMCVWLWAVFHVSNLGLEAPIANQQGWVFALPPLIAFAAGMAGWSTKNSPAAFAVFLSLFVGISWAAKTLEKVDTPTGNATIGRILATAVLMYLAPIGVWVLRPKILRVAARSQGSYPSLN